MSKKKPTINQRMSRALEALGVPVDGARLKRALAKEGLFLALGERAKPGFAFRGADGEILPNSLSETRDLCRLKGGEGMPEEAIVVFRKHSSVKPGGPLPPAV
jgi:hypothetical protein